MSGDPQYTGTNWVLTGLAGALTVGRLALRSIGAKRFFWDDLVHCIALAVLIAHGITNSITNDAKVRLSIESATRGESQTALLNMYYHVRYLNTINNCLLYMVFWVVKISFLLFYWFIFSSSKAFKTAWWIVMAITLLTFWVPIAGLLATCANINTVPQFKACDMANKARAVKLEYSCAINVITDVAIMMLPLWMLRELKVGRPQKIGLAFIFSLATVCVALDIVRTTEALASNQALFTILEINFVVIVSCLPTYRTLFTLKQRRARSKASAYPSGSTPSAFSSLKKPFAVSSWKRMENGDSLTQNTLPSRTDIKNGLELSLTNILKPVAVFRGDTEQDNIDIIGSGTVRVEHESL